MRFDNLSQWLNWLEGLKVNRPAQNSFLSSNTVAKRLNLSRARKPTILVGGTNGKGSCVALLESIYMAAGYRVGTLTSPHLVDFKERIRIQHQPISESFICQTFDLIDQVRKNTVLNYFQFTALAALWIFAHTPLDVVILEVGIGGRFDAVNVINPDLSIITNISLDHCDLLGNTREVIAKEKARIMRSDKPAICGDPNPPATLLTEAKKIGAKLFCVNKDFQYQMLDEVWEWKSGAKTLSSLPIPSVLPINAATVLMAVEKMQSQLPIAESHIIKGLKEVFVLARCQLMKIKNKTVLFDVAHNPSAAKVLREHIDRLNCSGKKYVVFNMLKDKDILGTLKAFDVSDIDQWLIGGLADSRAASIKQLCGIMEQIVDSKKITCYNAPADAFQEACQQALPDDLIVVFGSFRSVGEVMKTFVSK